jgi:hypothetical protein
VIYFGDSDIPSMMEQFGVPITIGAVTGVGIPDSPEDVFPAGDLPDSGGVLISVTKISVQTSAFPDLAVNDPVVFDGREYTVREHQRKGDGAMTEILLGV